MKITALAILCLSIVVAVFAFLPTGGACVCGSCEQAGCDCIRCDCPACDEVCR